jgi:hypothetical protein
MISNSEDVEVNVLEDRVGDVAVGGSGIGKTSAIMKVTYDR